MSVTIINNIVVAAAFIVCLAAIAWDKRPSLSPPHYVNKQKSHDAGIVVTIMGFVVTVMLSPLGQGWITPIEMPVPVYHESASAAPPQAFHEEDYMEITNGNYAYYYRSNAKVVRHGENGILTAAASSDPGGKLYGFASFYSRGTEFTVETPTGDFIYKFVGKLPIDSKNGCLRYLLPCDDSVYVDEFYILDPAGERIDWEDMDSATPVLNNTITPWSKGAKEDYSYLILYAIPAFGEAPNYIDTGIGYVARKVANASDAATINCSSQNNYNYKAVCPLPISMRTKIP
jgi:hypothetical protein